MGRMESKARRYKQAIQSFKSALVYHPSSAYLHYSIAQSFKALKNWKASFFWAKKMLGMNPKDATAHHVLGELYAITKKPKLAARSFQKAIQCEPKLLQAYLDLKELWSKDYGKQRKLIGLFQQLIRVRPDDYQGYLHLAELFERLGDDEHAVQHYTKALNRNPSSLVALSRVGAIYFRLQKWDPAIRAYQTLLDYRPDAWQFRLVLASSFHLRSHKHDAALAAYQFRHVMQEAPEEQAHLRAYRIAYELLSRGQLNEAQSWAKRTKKLAPTSPQAVLLLGQIAFLQGQNDAAIQAFQSIPAKVPSFYADAQARLIEVWLHKRDTKKAREILKQAKAKLSFSISHWIRLSQSIVERGNRKDRRDESRFMDQLAKQHPKNKELKFHRAYIAFKRRQYAKSEALLTSIVRNNPTYPAGLNFLGYLLSVQGKQLNRAARYIQRSLMLDPGNGYFLDSLGWVRFRQGKKKAALNLFQQAHHLLPTDAAILYHLARCHQSLRQHGIAIRLYRLARTYAPPRDLDFRIRKQLNRLTRRAARHSPK